MPTALYRLERIGLVSLLLPILLLPILLLPTPVLSADLTEPGEIFTAPVSAYFGITSARQPKDTSNTYYTIPTPTGDNADDLTQPWFDVSNLNLLAELDSNGLIEYPLVYGPLAGYGQGADGQQQLFQATDFIAGTPWTFSISDGSKTARLNTLPNTSVAFAELLFPTWTYRMNNLQVELLPFAPELAPSGQQQPRALVLVLKVSNTGTTTQPVTLSVPSHLRDARSIDATLPRATLYGSAASPIPANHQGDTRNYVPRFAEVGPAIAGYEAILPLDGLSWSPAAPNVTFSLAPGAQRVLSFGYLVGGGVPELRFTRDWLLQKSVVQWLNATRSSLQSRLGTLSIPGDPYFAELFARYSTVAYTSVLRRGDGGLAMPRGGSWHLLGMLAPQILAKLVPGGDLAYGCGGPDVSYSLYMTTLGSLYATDYYRRTGDAAFFADGGLFEAETRCLMDRLLDSVAPDEPLYPADYIWDGPARGDFHSGSQVLVWYVLRGAARIADEVWKDPTTASTWYAAADALKEALLRKNIVTGAFGLQLVEGSVRSGAQTTEVMSHDGEEVGLVLADYYGFLPPEDSRLTQHHKAAFTSQNYLFNAAVQGLHWDANGFMCSVTAPGWLPLLAGAATEAEQQAALKQWRRMTDVDGSVWWWPYDYQEERVQDVRRRLNYCENTTPIDTPKVDYATSVFNLLMINNLLGLKADVPAARLSFRPVLPWTDVSWTNARLGNAALDVAYLDNGSSITARLTNRNSTAYEAEVEVVVPTGKVLSGLLPSGYRYGRESYRKVEASLQPGASLTVTVAYQEGAESACVQNAWQESLDAHNSNPSGSWEADAQADLDKNGIPEGYEWRLLAEARCAQAGVETAFQANWRQCEALGWGTWWATLCAEYATVSTGLAQVVNQWHPSPLPLVPYKSGSQEPLSASGDFDRDLRSNLKEFTDVGGTRASHKRYGDTASTRKRQSAR